MDKDYLDTLVPDDCLYDDDIFDVHGWTKDEDDIYEDDYFEFTNPNQ